MLNFKLTIMKKFAFIFVATIAACFAISCNSFSKATHDSDSVDVEVIDTIDSIVVDTAAFDSI